MTRRFVYPLAAAFALLGFLSMHVAELRAQQRNCGYLVQVETKMVRVYAVVFDKEGRLATGLTQDDFRVLDNGAPQRIVNFSNSLREPVSIVLDADVSQSMKRKLSFVEEALDDTLAPFPNAEEQARFGDEFSLVRFATRAEVESPFLMPAAVQTKIGGFLQTADGATALFDSIYLAVDQLERNATNKRQAVILVTDGGDNHSRYSLRETRKFLEEADVPIFAVMAGSSMELLDFFATPALPAATPKSRIKLPANLFAPKATEILGPAERRGPRNLKALAEETGGELFSVRRMDDLPDVVQSIAVALRYSYVIGYEMPDAGAPHPKKWDGRHKVSVTLAPTAKYAGYFVDAKRGYYEGLR